MIGRDTSICHGNLSMPPPSTRRIENVSRYRPGIHLRARQYSQEKRHKENAEYIFIFADFIQNFAFQKSRMYQLTLKT